MWLNTEKRVLVPNSIGKCPPNKLGPNGVAHPSSCSYIAPGTIPLSGHFSATNS